MLGNGIGKRTPSRAGYAMAGVAPPGSASSSLTTAAAMVPSRSSSGSSSSPGVITPGEAGMEVIPTRVAGVAGNGGVASGRRQHGTVLMKRTRMTREQLATVVRKNFNAQPINESDVIVNFLYSVKNQGMWSAGGGWGSWGGGVGANMVYGGGR